MLSRGGRVKPPERKNVLLKSLNINPVLFFLGTDEEIKEAEEKEARRAAEIEKIIFSPDFIAARYYTEKGATRILHHSTRPGVGFQLSYIDSDGIPAMHENFIKTSPDHVQENIQDKNHLLKHFVDITLTENLNLEIVRR